MSTIILARRLNLHTDPIDKDSVIDQCGAIPRSLQHNVAFYGVMDRFRTDGVGTEGPVRTLSKLMPSPQAGRARSPASRSRRPSGAAPDKNMSMNNPNADWLNLRGTWVTNVLLVVVLKVLFTCVPRMTPEMSWTLTNLTYNIVRRLGGDGTDGCSVPFSSSTGSAARPLTRIRASMGR